MTAAKVELREVSNGDTVDIFGRCIHEHAEGKVEWTTQGTLCPGSGDHQVGNGRIPRVSMFRAGPRRWAG